MRPYGKAREASIAGIRERRATRPGGRQRQPNANELRRRDTSVADLNTSAVGLAVVLALTFALYILRHEEDSDEAIGNSGHGTGNRRGGLRK